MHIYLIRHTTPDVQKGTCYGQTDLDVTDTFTNEVAHIQPFISDAIETVYSSPLQRCKKLADALFPTKDIIINNDLMELNCGSWEMQLWDAIPKTEMHPWQNDFINVIVPGGESYVQLYDRVVKCFEEIKAAGKTAAIVAHGGVLRSIVAYLTQTPLKESFDVFSFNYGCVIKLNLQSEPFSHEAIYNVSQGGKEWHRPTTS